MPSGRPAVGHDTRTVSHQIRTRVWTAGRLLVLGAALVMTFFVFFLAAFRVRTRAREVRVPDLKGVALAEATARLSDVGLALTIEQRRPGPEVPVDHVLEQEPAPGAVLRRERAVRV